MSRRERAQTQGLAHDPNRYPNCHKGYKVYRNPDEKGYFFKENAITRKKCCEPKSGVLMSGLIGFLKKFLGRQQQTAQEPEKPEKPMSQALKKLLDGNARFVQGKHQAQKELYSQLANEGQFPDALVVTCSDSRVLSDDIFDAPPGTCFVIRNVGGFVPPYQPDEKCHGTTAAIEFAVAVLKVKAAIVMTHSKCAGVAKACSHTAGDEVAGSPIIGNWLTAMDLPKDIDDPAEAERIAAQHSLANLATIPCVAAAKEKGELDLAAMRINIETGEVEVVERH